MTSSLRPPPLTVCGMPQCRLPRQACEATNVHPSPASSQSASLVVRSRSRTSHQHSRFGAYDVYALLFRNRIFKRQPKLVYASPPRGSSGLSSPPLSSSGLPVVGRSPPSSTSTLGAPRDAETYVVPAHNWSSIHKRRADRVCSGALYHEPPPDHRYATISRSPRTSIAAALLHNPRSSSLQSTPIRYPRRHRRQMRSHYMCLQVPRKRVRHCT